MTFVKISSPQIRVGMGLNLSHQQISQSLLFLAQDRHREKLFFFFFFIFPSEAEYKRKAQLSAQQADSAAWGKWIAAPYECCTLHAQLREWECTAPGATSMARVLPTGLLSLPSFTYQEMVH